MELSVRISWFILSLLLLAGPWAFGSTLTGAIVLSNWAGYGLGMLLLVRTGLVISRWRTVGASTPSILSHWRTGRGAVLCGTIGAWMIGLLLYAAISAWNARMEVSQTAGERITAYLDCINWLPHSYHKAASWFAFETYLGLFFVFWATWALNVHDSPRGTSELASRTLRLSASTRGLLWLLTLNGAILALEGILQRLSGTNKLLWLLQPHLNRDAASQFGPFAYRSNAAQYINLIWPCSLGFWWTLREEYQQRNLRARLGDGSHWLALLCTLIMASAPFVTTSRGGMAVAVLLALGCSAILVVRLGWKSWGQGLMVVSSFALVVGAGCFLGWDHLVGRLKWDSTLSGRTEIYANARKIVEDYPVFGTGPGTFVTVYEHYKGTAPETIWAAYLHDDWLQTRLEWGLAGAVPIYLLALGLLCTGLFCRGPGGVPVLVATTTIALIGGLAHAKFDFPFQVHSNLVLYTVLSAMLLSVACRSIAARRLPE